MKNKRGFTLVELLAVIVILAVLILLALPTVLRIMENAQKKSLKNEGLTLLKQTNTKLAVEGTKGDCFLYKSESTNDLKGYVDYKKGYTARIKEIDGELTINISNGKYTIKDLTIKNANKKEGEEWEITNGKLKTTDASCKDYTNYLVKRNHHDSVYLNGPIVRNKIESIEFMTSNKAPSGVIGSWDVSHLQNGTIMAWYKDDNGNGQFEVYIGQEGGVNANPDSSWLFQNIAFLTNLDIINFDTSQVTNMSYMYDSLEHLPSLDISNFDTSQVTNMEGMFAGASSLTILDLSNFDTSNVTNMPWMFVAASSLTTLNLSSFDTSNVTNMDYMFEYTHNLTSLDIRNFDISKVTSSNYMFDGTKTGATIYVKDTALREWVQDRYPSGVFEITG